MKIASTRLTAQVAALAISLSLRADFALANVKMDFLALTSIDLALPAPTTAPLVQSHPIFAHRVQTISSFRTLPVSLPAHLASSIFQAHATLALILALLASTLIISA